MSVANKVYGATIEVPAGPASDDEQVCLDSKVCPDSKIGKLTAIARDIYRDDRRLQPVLLALMLLLYGPLLWISWKLSSGGPLDLTFNSMLEHLMHGQFDVDPKIVGLEGFGRNGHVLPTGGYGAPCCAFRFGSSAAWTST